MTSSGRKKIESNCLANFPRTISQTSSLFRHSQQKKGKLEARTKSILDKFSDLTYTKQYALTDGPKRGRGVNVGHSLSPPPNHLIRNRGLSSVRYSMLVRGSCGQVLFSNLESIHVRAAKIMFNLHWCMSGKEVLSTYVSETIIDFSTPGLLSSFTMSYELSFLKIHQ